MTVHKCDKCKKIIKNSWSDGFSVGGAGNSVDLCKKCFEPYFKMLKKDKILPERLKVAFE